MDACVREEEFASSLRIAESRMDIDLFVFFLRLPAAAAASILMASKISQLTIFYNGNVCVYDDVPPEKVVALAVLFRVIGRFVA